MKKRNYFLISGLIVALVAIGATLSSAAMQNNPGRARGRIGLARLIGAKALANRLNLTPDQKTQIKAILQNNKTRIQTAARDIVKARLDIANDGDGAAGELALARSQAKALRNQILDSIRPILTQDQLQKFHQLQELKKQRLQKILNRLNSRIGENPQG